MGICIILICIETYNGNQPPEESINTTNIPPIANAGGPYYQTINNPVYFNGTSSYDSDGEIYKYEWNFGDGATSNELSPVHTYEKIGNYKVELIITDDEGEVDSDFTFAYITNAVNTPPSKPIIEGISLFALVICILLALK